MKKNRIIMIFIFTFALFLCFSTDYATTEFVVPRKAMKIYDKLDLSSIVTSDNATGNAQQGMPQGQSSFIDDIQGRVTGSGNIAMPTIPVQHRNGNVLSRKRQQPSATPSLPIQELPCRQNTTSHPTLLPGIIQTTATASSSMTW